jgi:cellulose 1,4-beta-cellobiosidase
MDADGGMSRFPANKAGAKYGTGYCDAQCPKDGKFIGNNANIGKAYGSCCAEFDIWEANKYATQIASHPCSATVNGPAQVCQGTCRQCDTSGCAWNHYRGDKEYFGPGLKVDTTKKFTCVTQFVTDTGNDLGNLKEVRRLYVQGGKVIQNNVIKVEDWGTGKQVWHNYDSLTTEWCDKLSWDSDYENRGGHASMGRSLRRGHVLAMSLWTDGDMWWLDSGNDHGPCKAGPGKAALVRDNPRAYVEYSNIKFGDIGSTY